jgi:Fibronectin type III domain
MPPAGKPCVHDVTSTTCQLDWQPPLDDGGAPVSSYVIEQAEGTAGGEWRRLGTTYVRHMVVRNLVAEHQYRFRVSAENMYGTSAVGDESDVITASGSAKMDATLGMNYDMLG